MHVPSFKNALLVSMLGLASGAGAATTQADVDEAKLAQDLLAARQAAAESRQKIAEADAATAKAKLGTLDLSKFSAPEIEAKTLKIEGTILSYQAMERIAGAIATDVARAAAPAASATSGTSRPAVVLVTDKTLNAVQQARSFKRAAEVLHKGVTTLTVPTLAADSAQCDQPGSGGAGLGVLGGIDAAMQIAQLFKVDRSLEGVDVTLDDFALASSVLKALKKANVGKAVLASAYLPGGLGVAEPVSNLLKQVDALSDDQVTLDIRLVQIERKRNGLSAREGDNAVPLPDKCKSAFDAARRTYTALEISAKSLKERIDKFLAAAVAIDDKAQAPLLQTMQQAEALETAFGGAYLLHLKVIAGGGTIYTKKSLFSSSASIGGGGVVAYVLTGGTSGEVVTGGTVAEYGGFVNTDDLGTFIDAQRASAPRH
jgi:hypothetical protein